MTCLTSKSVAGLLAAMWVMAAPCVLAESAEQADGPVQVLTNLRFTSAAPVANTTTLNMPGWVFGSKSGGSLSVSATTPPPVAGDGSYALEANYPVSRAGGQYTWADYSVSALNSEDIYIDFWAKMPNAKGGCKFLKIFGKRNEPEGIAAVTLGANYTGLVKGGIANVEYGDGTTIQNSGQQTIFLNGAHPAWIGRSYGVADVIVPDSNGWPASNWGTSWHHFRVHVKFNSGTTASKEVPDGEVYVEIDGKAYVDATGLYNRNPANGPLDYIEFGGWAQTDPQAFDVWYDNIIISTGGFISDSGPKPPGNVAASMMPN